MIIDLKDKAFIQNPYPALEELRKTHPVYQDSEDSILVTGYKECSEILKKEEIGFPDLQKNDVEESWFSLLNKKDIQSLALQLKKCQTFNLHTLAFKNPPEHTRIKKLFLKAFRKTAIEDLHIAIEKICDDLIVELKDKKEIDLVEDFCMPFTNNVILYLMGYEGDDGEYLRQLSIALLDSMKMHLTAEEKKKGIESKILWARKAKEFFDNPALLSNDGLLHYLRNKIADGELSEDEFTSNAALLIMAGQETTQSYIASCFYHFLKNNIAVNEQTIAAGMQEVLRIEPPNLYITKFVRKSFEYAGCKFTAGTKVHFFLAAANRDDKVFERSNDFIVHRNDNEHISFGSGVHYCIGSFLALKETEIALQKLNKLLPKLKLKEENVLWKDSIRVRGLQHLFLINDSGKSN
jgi:cytochrome P450